MPLSARMRARFDVRTWQIAAAPGGVRIVFLLVELAALVGIAVSATRVDHGTRSYVVAGALAVLAVGFEESMAYAARLQSRLSPTLKLEMFSVWAVAAAISLPPFTAVLLLLVVTTYTWFRQNRPAGDALYRKCFNVANLVLSCLIACVAVRWVNVHLAALPWGVASAIAALAAIAVFTSANRLLVTCGLLAMGHSAKAVLGTRDQNLGEFAGLSLGGLLSLAVIHEPFLAVLVIAPLVTLQRSAAIRALETAATTDAKTGLLNAVAWEEVATRELARGAREGAEVGVLIIDVDHFKRVNDVHGHLVGDDLLRRIGQVLSSEVREYDTVARFGGEEFVAVLPGADAIEACAVAERIRIRVHDLWISSVATDVLPELDQRMGVSIGVAIAPTDGAEVSDLLQGADRALYRAKSTGRNRVVLVGDGDGPRHFSAR